MLGYDVIILTINCRAVSTLPKIIHPATSHGLQTDFGIQRCWAMIYKF